MRRKQRITLRKGKHGPPNVKGWIRVSKRTKWIFSPTICWVRLLWRDWVINRTAYRSATCFQYTCASWNRLPGVRYFAIPKHISHVTRRPYARILRCITSRTCMCVSCASNFGHAFFTLAFATVPQFSTTAFSVDSCGRYTAK